MFLFSPHGCPPSGDVRTSWQSGCRDSGREQSAPLWKVCSKKKICIRICELLLLGQGEVRERGGGRIEGEGKEMGIGREGKDKRGVQLQLPVSSRGSFRSSWEVPKKPP